ncbi:MAG: alpha/beta fold hydrolase [Brevundimonas sp.]|uniref:alpha/beta fold hydrolase n=1 Tax=Brevundimonas sp. TaxID=1871086 RepID=UPI00273687DE|nr:alpha/beta fold hydrolase [Brevundimonas sp.]MDP3406478.1 alpha/beta fold hydrolase [Brevundimonas sp.]
MKAIVLTGLVVLAVTLVATTAWLWTPDKTRPELEALYLARPGDMITVAGTRLHVRDTGPREAPTVILLHGFGASLHTWEPWAEVLEDDLRVIRLDLPGAGLSPPDPVGDYTDSRVTALLLALMDLLGVERASLVGNSVGGRLAWTLAAEHPDRVERLVLIAPDGFASPGFEYGKAPKVPWIMGLMRYALPRSMLRANIAVGYADPAALTEPTLTRYRDLMLAPGARQAMLDRMEQTVLRDPVPLLGRITAPVLLVWGEQDAMIPFRNAQDYQRALADVRLVSFPDLGHLPHEEAPAQSLPPVRAFLLAPATDRP